MTNDTLLAPFTRVPLFEGLSPARLNRIARAAERIVYQPNDIIQQDGDIGDAAVLIVSGKALIVDDPTDEDGDVVATGSLIGELAMLIETRAATTVVARSSVRAFRILRKDLRALMDSDPGLADHFVAKINTRLTHMAHEMRRVDALIASTTAKLRTPTSPSANPLH